MIWLPLPSYRDSVLVLSDTHITEIRYNIILLMDKYHGIDRSVSALPLDLEVEEVIPQEEIMWLGHGMQLCEYGLQACEEFECRGLQMESDVDIYQSIQNHLDWATGEDSDMDKPSWFGDIDVHLSHQAALLRLDYVWYSQHIAVADLHMPLVWKASRHAT